MTNNLLTCWDIQVAILTLPKTNISPDSVWLEDDISYWEGLFFKGYVKFTEGKIHLAKCLFDLFFGEDVGMSRDTSLSTSFDLGKQSSNDKNWWLLRVYSG